MLRPVHDSASFVEVRGHRLEYVDIAAQATGRPELLFLHEGLGSVSLWRDFPQRLASRTGCRAIVYSRAGFGRSSARREPFTPRFMHEEALEVIPALRERLAIEHPVLVGHSTGASMALIHAGVDSGPPAGVVAMAPFAFVEDSNLAAIRAAGERYSQLRDRLARHHDDVDGVFHGWSGTWLAPAFRGWNIDADLERIRCPVLALLGERDEYSTPAQLERIAAKAVHAQGVETRVLPGCGHSPHRDGPEALVVIINRFIETLET